jgi:hypothetical protein
LVCAIFALATDVQWLWPFGALIALYAAVALSLVTLSLPGDGLPKEILSEFPTKFDVDELLRAIANNYLSNTETATRPFRPWYAHANCSPSKLETVAYFSFHVAGYGATGAWFAAAVAFFVSPTVTFGLGLVLLGAASWHLQGIAAGGLRSGLTDRAHVAALAIGSIASSFGVVAALSILALWALSLLQPSLLGTLGISAIVGSTFAVRPAAWRALLTQRRLLGVLADPRRPILYLRSFAPERRSEGWWNYFLRPSEPIDLLASLVDGKVTTHRDLQRSAHGRTFIRSANPWHLLARFAIRSGGLRDTQMALSHALGRYGPYISIARPDEAPSWNDWGPTRVCVPAKSWKAAAIELIASAKIVVIEAGNSSGLLWEVKQVLAIKSAARVMLLLPKRPSDYGRFRELGQHQLSLSLPERPETRILVFNDDWTAKALGVASSGKASHHSDLMNDLDAFARATMVAR